MTCDTYYQTDLAWIHHAGYSQHVERTSPGIIQLLRQAGLRPGAQVLDVGCGSGVLARKLLAAGFAVRGVDASPAMIELARDYAPGADFEVLRLPTRLAAGIEGALPAADAVVSTGHVLNYLETRAAVAEALGELARALRPAGVLAIDWMTARCREQSATDAVHVKVEDDWVIVVRFSQPEPSRFDRTITVFRRAGESWRRSDEHHRNLIVDVNDALNILRNNGVDAQCRSAFGDERLPDGLVVLTGVRK